MQAPFSRLLFLAVPATPSRAARPLPVVDVYKSPPCDGCSKWVNHLESNGFKVRGLVVPAMPIGSPGMETGNRKNRYDVSLVDKQGDIQPYASH